MKNDIGDVVPRLEKKSVVTSKLIYKIKHDVDGNIKKHQARFIAQGLSHRKGIDYEKTFALVARYTSIRIILTLEGVMKWKLHNMDFKTYFLNDFFKEEVYVE